MVERGMSSDAILLHLQNVTLILAAFYNGMLAYEIRVSAWRMIASGITALILAGIAYRHYFG
jgi:hypothetical protein